MDKDTCERGCGEWDVLDIGWILKSFFVATWPTLVKT